MPETIKAVLEFPYQSARHCGPHDLDAWDVGTGKTWKETAETLGIDCTTVAKLSPDEGIHAFRTMLPKVAFDEKSCANGIEIMKNYHRK